MTEQNEIACSAVPSNDWLGFFGKGKKMLNVGFKGVFCFCFRFLLRAHSRFVTPHVLVVQVWLVLLFSFPVVAMPSSVELSSLPQRNEGAEVFNGNLQSAEASPEKLPDIIGPTVSGWVDVAKLGKDGRPEGGASIGSPSISLSPERKTMSSEGSKENSSKSYQCDGYCGLYLSLPLWIMAYWIALHPGKPNDKLRGAAHDEN